MTTLDRIPFEIWLAFSFLAFTMILSLGFDLPILLPTRQSASFVGIHYLYPLIGIAIWSVIVMCSGKKSSAMPFFVMAICYGIILWCHFNLKLWIPHINPMLWDSHYWAIDTAFSILVEGCMQVRLAFAPFIALDSNFYMLGFITLFYLSFGFHAAITPTRFRELAIAAMLVQIFGSIAYFIAPALGPFIFQAGVEPPVSLAQAHMLDIWKANSASGSHWLMINGGRELTGGLAAMPSLHAGGSLLFLIFAWRYARILLWVMVPLFAFITIDAIANRWHYLVDLPVGWMIALAAAKISHVVTIARISCGFPITAVPANHAS